MRTRGDYTEMVPSVDLKHVGLMHDSGIVQIVKLDFSAELYCFDLTTVNLNKNGVKILWYIKILKRIYSKLRCKKSQLMLRASQNKITCLSMNAEPTE